MLHTAFLPSLPLKLRPSPRPHTSRPQRITSCTREADPLTSSPLGAPKILALGEVLYDLFAPPNTPISNRTQWKRFPGGAPANVACTLATLGTSTAYIGNVGSDDAGGELKYVLQAAGVNVDGMQTIPASTREVFVSVDGGEREFVAFAGENESFADAKKLDLDCIPGVLFYAASVLVTGTLALAFESGQCMKEIVDMAKMCQLCVVVDVNWRDVFWTHVPHDIAKATICDYLTNADIVKLSVEEANFLYGDVGDALQDPQLVFERVQCAKGVLITDGGNGAAWYFRVGLDACTGRVEAVVTDGGVVDTTGAGDAFLGGFLAEMIHLGGVGALAEAHKVERMVRFGGVTAAHVVASVGGIGGAPGRDTVEAFLND